MREREHSSRMDSYGVRSLLWLVFRDKLECIFCSTLCANEQEKILHIFHNHNRIWDIGISKFTSIIKKLWTACFTHSDNVYTCVYCKATFHIGDIRILMYKRKCRYFLIIIKYVDYQKYILAKTHLPMSCIHDMTSANYGVLFGCV